MRIDPDPAALASLHEAHARMRSALALLDAADASGTPAAYLQHALCLLEEQLDPDARTRERKLLQTF